jgi:hypothetical protein
MSYDSWLEPDDVWDEDVIEFDRDDYEAMRADEQIAFNKEEAVMGETSLL